MADDHLPSDIFDDLPDPSAAPLTALAAVDTLEYHGIWELEKAARARRRIFEAESRAEIIQVMNETFSDIDESDREHLEVVTGWDIPLDRMLFDFSRWDR